MVHNMARFYGEEFSGPRPTPKMEDHTFHVGGRSSICNLRMRHAMVTGTHLWQYYPCDVLMFHMLLRIISDMALYSINQLFL